MAGLGWAAIPVSTAGMARLEVGRLSLVEQRCAGLPGALLGWAALVWIVQRCAGLDWAGQGRAGQGRAGQGRAEQGRAGQGRAGLAGLSWARLG